MKRWLVQGVALALFACACAPAHRVVKYDGQHPSSHGVVYYLPKTRVVIKLPVTKIERREGPFANIVNEVMPELNYPNGVYKGPNDCEYELGTPEFSTRTLPDTTKAYSVILPNWWPFADRDFTSTLDKDGFMTNASSAVEDHTCDVTMEFIEQAANITGKIFGIKDEPAPQLKEVAKEYAKRLKSLYKDRSEILRQANMIDTPETLKMRLTEIDGQIEGIKQMFTGMVKKNTSDVVLEVEPPSNIFGDGQYTATIEIGFFDPNNGFILQPHQAGVPDIHVRAGKHIASGGADGKTPLVVELDNLNKPHAVDEVEAKTEEGFRYRLPAVVTMHLREGSEILASEDMSIAQLGTEICLPRRSGSWLKTSYKVSLDPKTGYLQTLDASSKGMDEGKISKAGEAAQAVVNVGDPLTRLEREKKQLELEAAIEQLRNPITSK